MERIKRALAAIQMHSYCSYQNFTALSSICTFRSRSESAQEISRKYGTLNVGSSTVLTLVERTKFVRSIFAIV